MGARLDHLRLVEAGRNDDPGEARIDGAIGNVVEGPGHDGVVRLGRGDVIDSGINEGEGAGDGDQDAGKDGQQNFQITLPQAVRLRVRAAPQG